ncbi:MAG: hypothetical protein WC934_12350 [Acidithiobacillus sp.]|jgi:hypothetical protein|uniref:hypothetical protein n=1 Tax=Acidithiobacillus sp. TaxID=1872118 RepID=UPI003560ADD4
MGLLNKLVSKAIGKSTETLAENFATGIANKFGFLPSIFEKSISYKYPNTIRLAPDCLLFINGSSTLKFGDGSVRNFKNDVLNVNVSNSIDASPSTANFDIFAPLHNIDGKIDDPYFIDGECILKPMMEVEIYMKGRFSSDYFPVFWGLIGSISENYSDGSRSLSISCSDILRWWQLTNVNIKPSATSAQYTNNVMIANSTSFAGKNPHEIIIELAKTTMGNLTPPQGYINKRNNSDQIEFDYNKDSNKLIEYWEKRFQQLGRHLRLFGADVVVENLKQSPTTNSKQLIDDLVSLNQKNEEYDIIYRCVINKEGIEKFTPYHVFETSGSDAYTSIMRNKLEIAKDVSEIMQWEFFCDLNGEIVFKPPFYNLDVRNNKASVIDKLDILNESYTINEGGILTRIDVQGRIHQSVNSSSPVVYGYFQDHILAKKYGLRVETVEIPFVNTADQCTQYAALELGRRNALEYTGSITIIGRPELRLGYPVYISHRDEFYYLVGIDHSFSFGGDFDTTLTLVGRRKKVYKDKQKLNPLIGGVYQKSDDISDANSVLSNITFETNLDFSQNKNDIERTMKNDFISGNELGYYKLVETGNLINDSENAKIQYTDLEGYTVIGRYAYGISSEIENNDNVIDKQLNDLLNNRGGRKVDANRIANMSVYTFDVSPSNNAITLNKNDLMMLSNTGNANYTPIFIRKISDTLSTIGKLNTMVNRATSLLSSKQLKNISRKKIEQIATKKVSNLAKSSTKKIGKSLSKLSPF